MAQLAGTYARAVDLRVKQLLSIAGAVAALAAFAIAVFVAVLVAAPDRSAADTPDTGFKPIVEAIAASPVISFDDEGMPVVVYSDLDPDGPVFDADGNRIPDQDGARLRVLRCSTPLCDEPPTFVTRLPQSGEDALGFVVGSDVVFSTVGSDVFKICDAAACLGALVAVSIRANTSPMATIANMIKGADGAHHLIVTDHGDDGERSWLLRCVRASCPANETVELSGRATSLSISGGGLPLVSTVSLDSSVGLLACTDAACTSDEQATAIASGRDATATWGAGGNPVVATLDSSGVVSVMHCIDQRCTGEASDGAVVVNAGNGVDGVEVVDLTFAETLASRAPAIGGIAKTADGQELAWSVSVAPCAVEGCLGGGEPAAFFAAADVALAADGTAHIARVRSGGDPADPTQHKIDHTTCDLACQCKRSLCGPQTIRDVCGFGRADVALELELAVQAGDLRLVDLGLGETPGPDADLILGTFRSEELRITAGDTVCAGNGDDRIEFIATDAASPDAPSGSGAAFGGPGDDWIDVSALDTARVFGDLGDDVIIGTPGDDALQGESGDDTIVGSGGSDALNGGPGEDRIWGGDGDDFIDGDADADRLRGGAGNDTIRGGPGDDDMNGSAGDDVLFGEGGADVVRGGTGDDEVFAGAGDDVLVNGNGGEDLVVGGEGNDGLVAGGPRPDDVQGGAGDDLVKGNGGADTLSGGPGDDVLRGGPQPDTIFGGDGEDSCFGGTEPDTFEACETVTE